MDRTLKKAEELLPPELRSEFGASYLNILKDIWQPKGLWDAWKTHLASSGFVDFD
jgi:hypothetical protein